MTTIPDEFIEAPPAVNEFQRFVRVFFKRKLVVFGLVIIAILIFMAVFAPWVSPHDPYEQDLLNIRGAPSWEHPLGTDTLGRDLLSRIIYGSRTSLIVGIVAIGLAASIGISLGLVAGYFGGLIEAVIMRLIDAILAIPLILLALTIAALLGSGLTNIVIALGIGLVPPYARLVAGQTIALKEHDYISFLRAIGSGHGRIMVQHILPNSFPPVIVLMTTMLGQAILAEAGLSFLGVGVKPPDAAWGAMVSEGYRYLFTTPILSFAPGLAIMLTVFAVNMVGDGLRDAIDPRLRGAL